MSGAPCPHCLEATKFIEETEELPAERIGPHTYARRRVIRRQVDDRKETVLKDLDSATGSHGVICHLCNHASVFSGPVGERKLIKREHFQEPA